jgi:hypothetical protein
MWKSPYSHKDFLWEVTNYMELALLEKPLVLQLFKNFPAFCGIVGCKTSINNNANVLCVYMFLEPCN